MAYIRPPDLPYDILNATIFLVEAVDSFAALPPLVKTLLKSSRAMPYKKIVTTNPELTGYPVSGSFLADIFFIASTFDHGPGYPRR